MKTIDLNYQQFREQFAQATWFTGHFCKMGDMYYNHAKKVITELTYDELNEWLLDKIARYNAKKEEEDANIAAMKRNIKAHNALVAWAKDNSYLMDRSSQSESEYYFVQHTDGNVWQIRVSGHRYPTGSMTDLVLHKIDSTDTCCAKYCDMLGIEY